MAAVLACGEDALLSHCSAAALWEIGAEKGGVVDISVTRRAELKRQGLHVRGRPALRAEDITSVDDLPVTSVVQTLVDLATEILPHQLERAVNEADKHDLIDPEALRAALDDHTGKPGVKALRLLKQVLNGFEVDFFFPTLGLVIETDGLRYHRTPSTQARDAQRDRPPDIDHT